MVAGKMKVCVGGAAEFDVCDDEGTAGSRVVVVEPVGDNFAFGVGCEAVFGVDVSTFGAGVGADGRVKADGRAGLARGVGKQMEARGADGVTFVEGDVDGDDVKFADGIGAQGATFGGVVIGVLGFGVGENGAHGGVGVDGSVGTERGVGKGTDGGGCTDGGIIAEGGAAIGANAAGG